MYTKLFTSITDSTIWREPNHVRILWITMLAKCDPHGCVWASIPGIADAARLDLPLCQEALKVLSSPDPWSRSKEEEGKRIVEIDGGWQLVNHAKYKAIRSSEERREYKKLKAREYREKRRQTVDNVDKVDSVDPSDQIRSDNIILKKSVGFQKPTPTEVKEYGNSINFTIDGEHFCAYYETRAWKLSGGVSMKDWRSAVVTWKKTDQKRNPKRQDSNI